MNFTHVYAQADTFQIIDFAHPDTGLSLTFARTLEQVQERYPKAVLLPIDEWERKAVARQTTPITWEETTQKSYWAALEALPPLLLSDKGFLMGEPMDHDIATGRPRYQAYRNRAARYEVSSRPMTTQEFRQSV